ncbi:MAG: 50S ribosomal protein L13 [Candidatus Eisenbacteria bacterium]|nr:50S ribosomal protein L13 [Candidatus Eisenbacteria bacterium]
MGTYVTKAGEIRRRWYLVDAEGQTLGRLASEVAGLLRGKWKPTYSPHLDVGDHVVVVNAEKFVLTGRKMIHKTYFRHSGYLGHGRQIAVRERIEREPAEVVRDAVRGMLPHTRLGRQMLRKLKVYAGPTHPHAAQQPLPLRLGVHGKGYPGQEEPAAAGSEKA